jgi:hypothetical protein
VLKDLAPGEEVPVSLPIAGAGGFGPALSDRIFGQLFFDGSSTTSEATRRDQVRHMIVDQITNDPQLGTFGRLSADTPVLLAWGQDSVLDVAVEGQPAKHLSNVLYYIPMGMPIHGRVVFQGDLLNNTVINNDAGMFTKDPTTLSFGRGSATVSYRPLPFDGRLTVSHVRLGFSFGPEGIPIDGGAPIAPIPDVCMTVKEGDRLPARCPKPVPADQFDGMPEIELFDRTAGTWHRLEHAVTGRTYDLADAPRYVDPATGTLLVRYVNEHQDQVGFTVAVAIEGSVK